MELTVVGCSGSVSGPDSPASSYLIQAPHQGRTFSLLLDLGPGAFGALYRYLDPSEIDAIALTHLHADHCLDVCAFYVAAKYSATAPWSRRPIYGPAGTAQRLALAYDVPQAEAGEAETGISQHFDYRDFRPEQAVGPFDVRTVPVDHPVDAYALRVEERDTGASLVFSGDTGPCDALVDVAAGVHLLLIEAAFMENPSNPLGLHLTGRQAAQIGTAAGARAIVLTHIPPWHDRMAVLGEAEPHFDGPLMLAQAGAHWTIG